MGNFSNYWDLTTLFTKLKNKLKSISDKIDDSVSLKTATGNPITLTDAANANAEELSMTIEPVQDLHGYSKPWPAGGGKNLLPMTVDGIKAANTSGTWTGNEYTFNGVTFTIQTDSDGNVIGIKVTGTASGDSPSFYLGRNIALANGNYILNGCPANGSVPTYCMIAEWSGGDVKDLGNGISLSVSGYTINIRIRIQQNYAITSGGITFYPMLRLSTETDYTFAPYTNICPISGLTSGEVQTTDGTDTNTATISFGQTVYGGSVNFKTGEVTVTHAVVDMGTLPLNYTGVLFYVILDAIGAKRTNDAIEDMKASIYNNGGIRGVATITEYMIATNIDRYFYINDPRANTVAELAALISGETLCYELATPTTLTLTPAELELLKGNNTITANGAEISIKYYPDNAIGALAGRVDNKADITYVDNAVATKANTADVNTALAGKADITTVTIPAFTPSQAGWRRICKIKPVGNEASIDGMIYVGGAWSNGQPPSASIAVSIMHASASLTLLSSAIGDSNKMTAMRLVYVSSARYWLDVYFPAYSSNTGPFKLTFTGDIVISNIQNPIYITTDATAASAEISLYQNVSGRVLTDESTGLSDVTKLAYLNNVTSDVQAQLDRFKYNMIAPTPLNTYTNNGVRTIYQSVIAYINGLSASSRPRGFVQFMITYSANTLPSDLPSSNTKWYYAWGEIYFRNIDYVDATIMLHPYGSTDGMFIKQVMNSTEGAWQTVLTDKSDSGVIALNSGWNFDVQHGACTVEKQGNIAWLSSYIYNSNDLTPNTAYEIGTLPAGFIPSKEFKFPIYQGTSLSSLRGILNIKTTGKIEYRSIDGSKFAIYTTIMYSLN